MGFSVTAANVIFFVAILSAGSVAMSGYWKTESYMANARDAETQHVYNLVHTNITLSAITCSPSTCKGNGANNTVAFSIFNGGDTAIDLTQMTYVIQGAWTNKVTTPTVSGPAGSVGTTNLLLPGETAAITLYQVTFNSGGNIWLKATTNDGVSVSGKK